MEDVRFGDTTGDKGEPSGGANTGWRRRVAGFAAVGALFVVAACGSESSSQPSTTPASSSESEDVADSPAEVPDSSAEVPDSSAEAPDSSTEAPAEVPDSDELVWGVDFATRYTSLDPMDINFKTTCAPCMNWNDLIYGTMILETPTGTEPGLALEWATPDDRTIQLKLREGVKFHDGEDFNAEAVKIAWDRLVALGENALYAEIQALESVDVLGPYEVQVNLSEPVAKTWLDRHLRQSFVLGVPSPKALADGLYGDVEGGTENPVGAGPYRFVEYQDGVSVTIERVDDGWEADRFHFNRIRFDHVAFGAPMVAAIRSGAIDGGWIEATEADVMSDAGFTVTSSPSSGIMLLGFCGSEPPFDNIDARRAVAHALDPEAINQVMYLNTAVLNRLGVPANDPFFAADLNSELVYDVDEAKALAESSGLAGSSLDLAWMSTIPGLERAATVIQDELAQIGVTVQIASTEGRAITEVRPHLHFTVLSASINNNLLLTEGSQNACGSDWPLSLTAYEAATDVTLTPDEAAPLWRTFQEAVIDELPAAWLLSPMNLIASAPDLQGLTGAVPPSASQQVFVRDMYRET